MDFETAIVNEFITLNQLVYEERIAMQDQKIFKGNVAVVTNLISRKAGGLFTSVRRLTQEIELQSDVNIMVFAGADEYSYEDSIVWRPLRLSLSKTIGPKNFAFSISMIVRLLKFKPDVIHLHGLWTWASFVSLFVAKTLNIPVIITPRGMVDSWALSNSQFKKKCVLFLYEKRLFDYAVVWHALNEDEKNAIYNINPTANVVVIPNGIDIKDVSFFGGGKKKQLLFLGRIHSKKGIGLLIDAWTSIDNVQKKDWVLIIAGWGDKLSVNYVKNEILKKGSPECIKLMLDGVFGDEKADLLKSSSAFILPSFSEGLPMSVLEAWSFRLPVIMTRQCNIPEGFTCNAALEMTTDVESCRRCIEIILDLSTNELSHIGDNGFELVKELFTWEMQAKRMISVYNDVMSSRK